MKKPFYRLVSEFSNGSHAEVEEIYSLCNVKRGWVPSRRSFAKGSLTVSSSLSTFPAAFGCATKKEMKVDIKDYQRGVVETKTLPRGSPIPPGAVCVCNCIPL